MATGRGQIDHGRKTRSRCRTNDTSLWSKGESTEQDLQSQPFTTAGLPCAPLRGNEQGQAGYQPLQPLLGSEVHPPNATCSVLIVPVQTPFLPNIQNDRETVG